MDRRNVIAGLVVGVAALALFLLSAPGQLPEVAIQVVTFGLAAVMALLIVVALTVDAKHMKGSRRSSPWDLAVALGFVGVAVLVYAAGMPVLAGALALAAVLTVLVHMRSRRALESSS